MLLKIYPEGLSFFTPLDSYWKEKDWPNNPYGKELHKLYIDLTLSSYNKRKKVWYLSSKFPDVYPVVGVKEKYFHEVKGFFHKLPDDENHVELTRELVDEYETPKGGDEGSNSSDEEILTEEAVEDEEQEKEEQLMRNTQR